MQNPYFHWDQEKCCWKKAEEGFQGLAQQWWCIKGVHKSLWAMGTNVARGEEHLLLALPKIDIIWGAFWHVSQASFNVTCGIEWVCCLKYVTRHRQLSQAIQNHDFKGICINVLSKITPDYLSSGWEKPFPSSSGCIFMSQRMMENGSVSAVELFSLCNSPDFADSCSSFFKSKWTT